MNSNGTRWENDAMCYTKVTSDNKDRNKTKNLSKALKLGKSLKRKCWGQNIYSEIPINYNLCPWTYFCEVSYGSEWQKFPSFIYLAHSVCFLIQTYKIFTNCHVYKHELIFVWCFNSLAWQSSFFISMTISVSNICRCQTCTTIKDYTLNFWQTMF